MTHPPINDPKVTPFAGVSATAQQSRLLRALRTAKGGMTTLEARRKLDILHPAGRVKELREYGHRIITHWTTEVTDYGEEHRVARYVLLEEAKGGGSETN